ncbi:SH3 domain-containing protein [Cytophagaceae bacterium ABcell3]|nr:SH3 domain-containing protein [Cytophagaceae bacterium ABcell3]
MKTYCLCLLMFLWSNLYSQESINQFIEIFPQYKWDDLPEMIYNLPLGDKLDIDKANEFMWDDKAVADRKKVTNYSWAVKGPHYITVDGSYAKSELGRFHKKSGFPDKPYNNLFALGRVDINPEIVLLILYYDGFDWEAGYLKYFDIYSYNRKQGKFISATSISRSVIDKDFTFTQYDTFYDFNEELQDMEEYFVEIKYSLNSEGYFQQTSIQKVQEISSIFRTKVNDTDGWVNVREKPNINSKVVFKVKDEKYLLVEDIDNKDWYRVIEVCLCALKGDIPLDVFNDGNKKLIMLTGGYIHKSRVGRR